MTAARIANDQAPMTKKAPTPASHIPVGPGWNMVLGHLFVIGIWSFGLLLLGGCNVIGAVAQVAGPPDVEPLYVPAKTPMLVLAENYSDLSGTTVDGEQLERFVIEELQAHDVAPIADCGKVYTLRAGEPQQFRTTSIDQLGRIAGAAQVLYINLHSSSTYVGQGSEVFHGRGSALVRIVDVETGQTLWPVDAPEGFAVGQDSRLVRARPGVDDASVRRDVLHGLADQIGKLFYKYKPDY